MLRHDIHFHLVNKSADVVSGALASEATTEPAERQLHVFTLNEVRIYN